MVICQKDPSKGNAVDNYRPILCLPLMWKLMTRTIAERIYNFLDVNDKLPVDKKDVGKKVEGPKINYELIRIDKTVLFNNRKRHTNLGMV